MCFEIVVTQKCNLACKYCFEERKENKSFTEDEIPIIIDFLNKYITNPIVLDKEIHICFNGGEALLNYLFIKKFILLTSYFVADYSISTNLSLLTDEMLLFFRNFKVRFHVSIDGKKETNDKNRFFRDKKGYYNILLKNLDKLKESELNPISLSMVYTPDTVRNLYENVVFLYEKGFRRIHASYASNYIWTEGDSEVLADEMIKIRNYYIEAYKEGDPFYFSNFSDTIDNIMNHNGRSCICGGFVNEITLMPDGMILPCLVFVGNKLISKFNFGNWKNDINIEEINNFRNRVNKLSNLCKDCEFSERCHKTCYAELELTKSKSECVSGIGCFVNQISITQSERIIKDLIMYDNHLFMQEFSQNIKFIRLR